MSARHKLNQAYVHGALVFAAVIGAVCGSWVVFWVTAAILVGLSLHSGDIRPTGGRHGNRRPPRDR